MVMTDILALVLFFLFPSQSFLKLKLEDDSYLESKEGTRKLGHENLDFDKEDPFPKHLPLIENHKMNLLGFAAAEATEQQSRNINFPRS